MFLRLFFLLIPFFIIFNCAGKRVVKNPYIFVPKKKIYFNLVLNQSGTPNVEDGLIEKIREYFTGHSRFTLVNSHTRADQIITIYIDEFKLNLEIRDIYHNYFKGTIVLNDKSFSQEKQVSSEYIVFYDQDSDKGFNQDRQYVVDSFFDDFTQKLEKWLIYKLL